jgi:Tfp pilus assembly protein PilF
MVLLDNAIKLHQEGQIEDAEQAYREILAAEPNHPGALHLLGVIRQQQGRHEEALGLIGRAIKLKPDVAVYHNNYGAALLSLQRLAEAKEGFLRALKIRTNYADALANLGMAQAALGEDPPAEDSFRRALHCEDWHRDAVGRPVATAESHGGGRPTAGIGARCRPLPAIAPGAGKSAAG